MPKTNECSNDGPVAGIARCWKFCTALFRLQRLSVKVTLSLLIIALLPLFFYMWETFGIITRGVSQIERAYIQDRSNHAVLFFQKRLDALQSLVVDNASWDEMYEQAEVKDPVWIKENLTEYIPENQGIDLILALDRNRQVIAQYGPVYDYHAFASSKINAVYNGEKVTGFLRLPTGLYEVAAAPILDSHSKKKPRGILLFGKLIDQKRLKAIEKESGVELNLYENGEWVDKSDAHPRIQDLTGAGDGNLTIEYTSRYVFGIKHLRDLQHRDAGYLVISSSRSTYNAILSLMKKDAAILIAYIVILIALLTYFFEGIIVKPIVQIERQLRKMGEKDSLLKLETKGWEELKPLVQSFNNLVDSLNERKEIERDLAHFDRLNLVGELAASIGHEVRNPMTTVRGYLQLLKRKEDCKEYIPKFDLMIEELDRANAIITEFLALAKDRKVDLKLENLNKVLRAMHPLILADAVGSEAGVILELGEIPDLPLDENQIRQLILNLVRNGLEAMPAGGILKISTYLEEQEVVLAVSDQGSGIGEEVLKNIGRPFFTTKEKGTGLGLAVCYSIAARHNAFIKVETGHMGTIFYVRFRI